MHSHQVLKIFSGFLFLVLIGVCMVPVSADTGAVTITYRGAGGYYVGDSVAFDGKNTLGNTTMIRITGPGLPAEGVPPYDLTGTPGTGTAVTVDDTHSWSFYWDMSRVVGVDHIYTSKYTFTAYDADHPNITTSIDITLKKPEFYVSMTPNPATPDDYVMLTGYNEKGADNLEIDVLDSQGNKVDTYFASTYAGGGFNFGFHVDMPPGQYTITIGSPSMTRSITQTLTVTAARANTTVSGPGSKIPVTNSTVTNTTTPVGVTPAATPSSPAGSLVVSSKPVGASVYLDSVLVGTTPLTLNTVSPGAHTVEIRSPRYLPCSIGITVSEGKATEMSPEMVKSPSSIPLSPFAAVFGCIIGALCIVAVRSHRK